MQSKKKENKKKWSLEENKKLFKLHIEIGNKWKKIAEKFKGRTDNSLKNNFFSIIRKALRSAYKVIGKQSNTNFINKIKPKVLSKFVVEEIFVDFKDYNGNILEKNKEESFLEKNGRINLEFFVEKFAFERFAVIYSLCGKKDIYCIKQCLKYLLNLNKDYENRKNGGKYKKNNLKVVERKDLKVNELDLSGFNFESNQFNNLKNNKDKNLGEVISDLKKTINEEKEIRILFKNQPLKLKKKLILQFEKIQILSQNVLNKIWMASDEDLKKYSKKIDMSKLINSFTKKKNTNKLNNSFLKNSKLQDETLFFDNSKNKNHLSFLNNSKKKDEIHFFDNSKFNIKKTKNILYDSSKINKLNNSSNSKNSLLKINIKKNFKDSKFEMNNSLVISGFGSLYDSIKNNHNNAKISFNNIFSNQIKNGKNSTLKNNNLDPILSNIKTHRIDFNTKNSEIDFNMKNSGIGFNLKNSGIDFNRKNSEMDFNMKNSGIGFNLKNSGIDFNRKNSEMDFNMKNSGTDFNMKNSGIDLLKSKFCNQFFDLNKI